MINAKINVSEEYKPVSIKCVCVGGGGGGSSKREGYFCKKWVLPNGGRGTTNQGYFRTEGRGGDNSLMLHALNRGTLTCWLFVYTYCESLNKSLRQPVLSTTTLLLVSSAGGFLSIPSR